MDPKELDVQINDLETRIDRLKALYEQYFQGIERLEPTVPRKEVDRKLAMLRKEQIRNTAQRFRLQSLVQRYTSYQTHWGRITRQIEEGTYKRDLLRAKKLRQKLPDETNNKQPEWALAVDFEDTNDFFNDLGFDTTEHVKPPMGAPAPASMSFARPKERPESPAEKAPVAARRIPSVPPRPMTAAPQVPAIPGAPLAPRAPSPLAPPRAPAASAMPARAPMPTAAPSPAPRAPMPAMAPAPRAPMPTASPSPAPRAPMPAMAPAPRAPIPTAAPSPAPRAPMPTMAPAPRAPAPPIARPPSPTKKPGT
jgi:hypothetical protein